MVIWEYWLIGIGVALVAIAFVVLTVFSIMALISLRKLMRDSNELVVDVEEKVHALDPYFNVVSGVGEALERFSCRKEKGCSNKAVDILECALVGLTLWQKIKEKK